MVSPAVAPTAGFIAVVAIVLFIRYRILKLTLPIVFIGLSEVIITLALVSLISKFDLGAVAGLLAVVGTGVDHQIIITDELIQTLKDNSVESAPKDVLPDMQDRILGGKKIIKKTKKKIVKKKK